MADDIVGASVIGAPLPENQTDFKPMLMGMGESVIVTVHNPLTSDFRVQYARSVVQSAPSASYLKPKEKEVLDKSGITVDKDFGQSQAHSVQYLVLKSGQTINLPGDIAQKAVRQLVNYMIQTRNKGNNSMPLADAFTRHEVEQEIIVNISDNMTFFNPGTPEEKTQDQITKLNTDTPVPPVESTTNPPPGTGTSYEPGQSPSPSTKDKV